MVTFRRYVPAGMLEAEGKVAMIVRFVKETTDKAAPLKVTVGATPDGLKFWPWIVIWLFV